MDRMGTYQKYDTRQEDLPRIICGPTGVAFYFKPIGVLAEHGGSAFEGQVHQQHVEETH